jgi:hypothetical protein
VYRSFYAEITLRIQELITLTVLAGFSSSLDNWGLGLLGQFGFFDRVPVNFNLPLGYFEIQSV